MKLGNRESVVFTRLDKLRSVEARARAGKADLGAADDLRRLALAERPLRAKFFKMLVQSFGPEGNPAAGTLHETHLEFRVAIEYALAGHVHERDHTFERKRGHVHVAVLLHTLATRAHDAPHGVLAVVLCLRVHGERHADLLRGGVNLIEHTVA